MKNVLRGVLILALLCFGLAGIAAADSCPINSTNCLETGGVTFTFTNGGSSGNTFFVDMTVTGNTVSTPDTLTSFALQISSGGTFGTVSDVTGPPNTGNWTVEGLGPNTANGCNINNMANHWCIDGGGISFPASGSFLFVISVTGLSSAPDAADLMAFQDQEGIPGISAGTGIGGGTPPPVPEPTTMLLLGLGLAGAPLLRKVRPA